MPKRTRLADTGDRRRLAGAARTVARQCIPTLHPASAQRSLAASLQERTCSTGFNTMMLRCARDLPTNLLNSLRFFHA